MLLIFNIRWLTALVGRYVGGETLHLAHCYRLQRYTKIIDLHVDK